MHECECECDVMLRQAREEAIARGEDPDAAEALILNGGEAPAAVVKEPEPPQPQTTGLEGGGLGIDADVRLTPETRNSHVVGLSSDCMRRLWF